MSLMKTKDGIVWREKISKAHAVRVVRSQTSSQKQHKRNAILTLSMDFVIFVVMGVSDRKEIELS